MGHLGGSEPDRSARVLEAIAQIRTLRPKVTQSGGGVSLGKSSLALC